MENRPQPEDERDKTLLALLAETNLDLRAWRERNWVAFRDAVAAILAVGGIAAFRREIMPLLVVVLIGIGLAAHIYLKKNFQRYEENVEARRRIESALRLHEADAFLPGKPLFPEAWIKARADRRGSYTFVWSIWFIALLTAIAVAMQWWFT
jgi:hypothetical protein